MGFAQIVILLWFMVMLLIASNRHGKRVNSEWNFWVVLGAVVAQFVVLMIGGFFK